MEEEEDGLGKNKINGEERKKKIKPQKEENDRDYLQIHANGITLDLSQDKKPKLFFQFNKLFLNEALHPYIYKISNKPKCNRDRQNNPMAKIKTFLT